MKKTILVLAFLISAITFISCSSDDNSSSKDPIIGTWGYIEVYENGIKGELDNCDLQDIKVFNEDGTFSSEYYESSTGGDNCDKQSYTGTWKNNGDNKYTVIEDGDTLNYTITFDGDTFSFEEKDGDDIYRDVFKKK